MNTNYRKVVHLEKGTCYKTVGQCAYDLGLNSGNIYSVCIGKISSTERQHFMFLEDFIKVYKARLSGDYRGLNQRIDLMFDFYQPRKYTIVDLRRFIEFGKDI